MTDETPESLIPYDEIVQDALRAVVGRVLGEVEQSGGLPGDHHFYITFKTRMPGVAIPKHLLEQTGLSGEVEIRAEGDALVIRPVKRPRANWAAAFREMARRCADAALVDVARSLSDWDEGEWGWQ